MPDPTNTPDQDQSEVFDETHLDDEGDGDFLLDEAEPVLDVTRANGDLEREPFDRTDPDLLLDATGRYLSEIDTESTGQRGADEIELVYSGLMRNARGAQASAAHWEAKRLSDDDIAALGYGPDDADADADADTASPTDEGTA
jgi:hypothetical protein